MVAVAAAAAYGRVARDPSSFPLFPGSAAGAAALRYGGFLKWGWAPQ